jgi:methylated-DNA-[protein]-cysteine S-methyltransferase
MYSSSRHTAARAGATAGAIYASPVGELELLASDRGLRLVDFLSQWTDDGSSVSPSLLRQAQDERSFDRLRVSEGPGDRSCATGDRRAAWEPPSPSPSPAREREEPPPLFASPSLAGKGPGDRSSTAAAIIEQAALELDQYLAGRRTIFTVALDLTGTPFQLSVWNALLAVPYAATLTYRELATAAGRPAAIRAAGAANGANPISIIVPCHRVIGSDASLTGYGGGLPLKRYLIDLERKAMDCQD